MKINNIWYKFVNSTFKSNRYEKLDCNILTAKKQLNPYFYLLYVIATQKTIIINEEQLKTIIFCYKT
jgi:hypothetical protein